MIERVHLKNFRAHADTVIEPGRLTVLVGPNGAGKTSVLEAIHLLGQLPTNRYLDVFAGRCEPKTILRQGEQEFAIRFEGRTGTGPWSLALTGAPLQPKIRWGWGAEEGGDDAEAPSGYLSSLAFGCTSMLLRLDVRRLATLGVSAEEHPEMRADGSNLANALAYLMTADRSTFQSILASLQSIVPRITDLRSRPKRQTLTTQPNLIGQELLFDYVDAKGLPAELVSDGTLVTLGVLAALHSSAAPNLILLDYIEQALHPGAQRMLIKQIREVLKQRPELQIVANTHSPYVVDECRAEEVWVLANRTNGTVGARRLSDHPHRERALQVLTTGEFWSAEGEDWVTQDTPQ